MNIQTDIYICIYIYNNNNNGKYQLVLVGHIAPARNIRMAPRCSHIKMAFVIAPSRNVVMTAGANHYTTLPTVTDRFGFLYSFVLRK